MAVHTSGFTIAQPAVAFVRFSSRFPLILPAFPDEPYHTHIVPPRDGGGKLQRTAEALGYPPVPAHGVVAQVRDLLIRQSLLLPCLHQRTVVEIYVQMVIVASFYVHLKDPLGELRKEGLSKTSEGFPHIHPHMFRHTHASILLACGEDIATVSQRLGHTSVHTTTKIYIHSFNGKDKSASSLFTKTVLPDEINIKEYFR